MITVEESIVRDLSGHFGRIAAQVVMAAEALVRDGQMSAAVSLLGRATLQMEAAIQEGGPVTPDR